MSHVFKFILTLDKTVLSLVFFPSTLLPPFSFFQNEIYKLITSHQAQETALTRDELRQTYGDNEALRVSVLV